MDRNIRITYIAMVKRKLQLKKDKNRIVFKYSDAAFYKPVEEEIKGPADRFVYNFIHIENLEKVDE